jgi:magnesium and cobalt exporter, CNNM family
MPSGRCPILSELFIILALILANGLFSGAEIAVVSLRRTRLQQLLDEDKAGAKALERLRKAPEWFLATVQVGITVVGTTAAAFGGSTMAGHLAPVIQQIPNSWVQNRASEIALGIVIVLVSYFSLVLGELVPKSLALRAGEPYALLMAKPLLALSWLARPVVWFMTVSSNVILKPFRDRTTFLEARISKEEIQQMVEEAAETGALHEHASEIASRALQFDKLLLGEVMIPRNGMDALPITAKPDQVRRFLLEERRSRIPVYEGTVDNVVGYVSAKDIVALAWEGHLIVLPDLLRPVKLFPETVPAIEVLQFMRREHKRLAIAIDEHGALSGMVTFEDLVEELVGEVFSEHEEAKELIQRLPDGNFVVRGEVPLREINRELPLPLDEPPGVTTLAGLCGKLANGIPNRGARLAANDGIALEVMDATARMVGRVRIIPPKVIPLAPTSPPP